MLAKGKVSVVTGGNIGIGYEICKGLLRDNGVGTVVLSSRSEERGEEAAGRLRRELGAEGVATEGRIRVMVLDLEDLDSVDSFAAAFLSLGTPLDILVCNAGMLPLTGKIVLTKEGHERTFCVNHLGHFLLDRKSVV